MDYIALAKRLINREDGDWQPLLDHLADDVVFKVTIPEGTPVSGEFRGKQAVTEHFERLGDLLEFRQEQPMEFLGSGSRVVVLGCESFEIKETGDTVSGSEYADVIDFRDGLITRFGGLWRVDGDMRRQRARRFRLAPLTDMYRSRRQALAE
jgi:ketosteroid isomerase-like protein